jgi:hypothetical protein
MRRSFFLFLLLCFAVPSLFAQGGFTTVTGTVTGPDGLVWACGTISAQLITAGGASPTLNGGGFTTQTSPVGLGCPTTPGTGASGSFAMRLADSGVIVPGNTTWQFTVNMTPGIAPPQGTGPQSLTFTTAINCGTNTPSTCTSNTISISSQLSAAAPKLSNSSSSGGTPGGADTNVQYNNAGVFGGDANFTWNKTSQSLNVVLGSTGTASILDAGTTAGFVITPGAAPSLQLVGGGEIDLTTGQILISGAPFNIQGSTNSQIVSGGTFNIFSALTTDAGIKIQSTTTRKLGFYGATPIVQPAVTGTIISGTGLTSLLTQLATLGIISNSTTNTNCASAASPAVCGTSAAGSVAVPTGATPTLQINTTAITANSQVFLTVTEAPTTGTRLGVTCNTTLSTLVNPVETARVAGTSFTIQMNSTLAVNPACVHYEIVN